MHHSVSCQSQRGVAGLAASGSTDWDCDSRATHGRTAPTRGADDDKPWVKIVRRFAVTAFDVYKDDYGTKAGNVTGLPPQRQAHDIPILSVLMARFVLFTKSKFCISYID